MKRHLDSLILQTLLKLRLQHLDGGVAGLLTSEVYGLQSQLSNTVREELEELRQLEFRDRRSATDNARLKELKEELEGLDLSATVRDPLYAKFVRAMTEAQQEQARELRPLTPEEIEEQREEASKVFAGLKTAPKKSKE